ncbi:MAG: hypothetical protein ACJAW3_000497 [Lentimonas sp.]|jgi:hypothetical protein
MKTGNIALRTVSSLSNLRANESINVRNFSSKNPLTQKRSSNNPQNFNEKAETALQHFQVFMEKIFPQQKPVEITSDNIQEALKRINQSILSNQISPKIIESLKEQNQILEEILKETRGKKEYDKNSNDKDEGGDKQSHPHDPFHAIYYKIGLLGAFYASFDYLSSGKAKNKYDELWHQKNPPKFSGQVYFRSFNSYQPIAKETKNRLDSEFFSKSLKPPIFICGEAGSGKLSLAMEIASIIKMNSSNPRPFGCSVIRCHTLPELMDSVAEFCLELGMNENVNEFLAIKNVESANLKSEFAVLVESMNEELVKRGDSVVVFQGVRDAKILNYVPLSDANNIHRIVTSGNNLIQDGLEAEEDAMKWMNISAQEVFKVEDLNYYLIQLLEKAQNRGDEKKQENIKALLNNDSVVEKGLLVNVFCKNKTTLVTQVVHTMMSMKLEIGEYIEQLRNIEIDPEKGNPEYAIMELSLKAIEKDFPSSRLIFSYATSLEKPQSHGVMIADLRKNQNLRVAISEMNLDPDQQITNVLNCLVKFHLIGVDGNNNRQTFHETLLVKQVSDFKEMHPKLYQPKTTLLLGEKQASALQSRIKSCVVS